jgi:1-acyl-sn-glycerol-3-phosphate acyltransferase
MKELWLKLRSLVLWSISGVHFAVVCMFLICLAVFVDPRKNDWPQRLFFRNILPHKISLFIANHVNIFDPFVVYSAIPQFLRGFELESHFKIPIYGWLMGRFGNIAVPDAPSRESLEIMSQRSRAALDSGISLIAFAEGSRTRDGHVKPFKKGIFNLAQKFGVPVVPVSIVGSFEFFQTGNWILYPGKITVYLHDTIETSQLPRSGVDALRQRVQDIVSGPVEESLKNRKA